MAEVPDDVSKSGLSGTLKSPPRIRIHVVKEDKKSQIFRKNATCLVLGV